MAGKVVVFGDVTARHEVEELLAQRHPEVRVESVGQSWELVERACAGEYDVALILRGPIALHQQRIDAVASLRRHSFRGKILVQASFLTERYEASEAGADYVFDPDRQAVEQVVKAALFRPRAAADHPYLRYLLLGEWAEVQAYQDELPVPPPELLLVATSCHGDPDFYPRLAAYTTANPSLAAVLVEDGGSEEAEVAALSSGVQPYVVLAEEGLGKVEQLARTLLREAWLRKVSAA